MSPGSIIEQNSLNFTFKKNFSKAFKIKMYNNPIIIVVVVLYKINM